MKQVKEKTQVLIEALPYIQQYKNKIVVIKVGGKVLENEDLKKAFIKDIILLNHVGIHPVLVHGGGPSIDASLKKKKIKVKKVHGLRVTNKQTLEIVKETMKNINIDLVKHIKKEKDNAVKANPNLIKVKQKDKKLGYVGKIKKINTKKILSILNKKIIPVFSPLGVNGNKSMYNINADTLATELAVSLKAEKLTLVTNVDGVLEKNNLISHLSIKDANKKIKKGIIKEGMIPKVQACIHAVKAKVKKAHLINGTTKHSLLIEIFTDKGIGTEIVK